jgi:hypothetical protein
MLAGRWGHGTIEIITFKGYYAYLKSINSLVFLVEIKSEVHFIELIIINLII